MDKFLKNLGYAFVAQMISVLFSLIMYLLVPKVVGTIDYSYWQLFLFYISYAGFFHLGLVDGIYLQTGGKKYNELNFDEIGSQLRFMTIFQFVIGLIFSIIVFSISFEFNRKIVIFSSIIYILIYCIENFLGFVLQAVNLTKEYSKAVIIEKTFCLFFTILFVIFKVKSFKYYILLYCLSKIFNLIYLFCQSNEIIFSRSIKFDKLFKIIKTNISIGCILMLSTVASNLILGSGKMTIDAHWGIEEFGKISFSLSIINIILLFIRQISMVLFPALKTIDDESKINYYESIKRILIVCLPLVYLAYLPMKVILELWIPDYFQSIAYLSLFLPLCVFDCKMQVLSNTYYKVFRKEKKLLVINIVIMMLALLLSIIGAFIIDNINFVIYAMIFSVVIRSIIAEIILDIDFNVFRIKNIFYTILEILIAMIFSYSSWNLSMTKFCLIIFISYSIYLIFNRSNVLFVFKYICNIFKKIGVVNGK